MNANELADKLQELDSKLHLIELFKSATMLRQQQVRIKQLEETQDYLYKTHDTDKAKIKALKNANRFIQNFAEEQHQRAVALEMRELTNAEIFWLADEYSDEENLVADCVGFARAVLRKAQKNG